MNSDVIVVDSAYAVGRNPHSTKLSFDLLNHRRKNMPGMFFLLWFSKSKDSFVECGFRPTAYALSTTITSEFIHRGRSSPVCLPPYLGRWFHNLCGSPER